MESDSTLLDEVDYILQATPTRISPIGCSGNKKDSINDCSSSKAASNKENMNVNKCEGQKLNVEPLQMKKKKKTGGFNLRKSLAWNRAFFTEEGVLDPLELSMISGTDISSSREGLSTINEDDSLSNDCQSDTESADLQALENNLFKEVPVVSLKSNKVHLPPKHSPARVSGASSTLVSAKVLPTRGATRTVSRVGSCTRPLPSSSLKRPANVSTSQAVTKESKLPRIPSSRPGHPSILLKNRSATGNIKHKQITQPAVIITNQRNNAPKSSLKSAKSKADPGPLSVKASISHSNKTVLNSQARNKVTDTVPKLIPDHVGSSIARPPPECLDGPSKFMASHAHATSTTSSAKPQKQFLPMKPSGLRMPSPSLGFFGQPKASVPHCAPQNAMKNPGYSKPPLHTPVRVAGVNYSIATVETVLLRSKSDSQDVSHERIKQNVGENSVKELIFSNDDEPSEHVNDADAISSDLDCNVLGCTESKMSTCIDVEKHDLSLQQQSSKCAKAVSRTRNSTDPSKSCLEDLHHVPEEQGNILFESSSGKPARLSCGNDHLLGEKSSNSKDSHNHLIENVENTDFETPAFIKNEEKSLGSAFPERCEKSEKPLLEYDVTFQSHSAKTELQMENVISTSRLKDILNHRSEVGYSNDFASNILEQSPYTVKYPPDNSGTGSGKYTQEDTEALPGTLLDVDSTGEISEKPIESQNECFDERTIVGKALENNSLQSSFECTSLVQRRNYSDAENVGSDVICSSAITTSDSHSARNGSYAPDGQVNNEGRIVEDPKGLTSVGTSLESQIADISCGYVLSENILHGKQQSCSLQNIRETDPIVYESSMIPSEVSETPVKNARQTDERVEEEISSSIPLQVETKLVQNPSCNVPVESCIEHMQLVSDQYIASVASEISDEAGLSNLHASVEKVPQADRSSIPDSLSSGERTIVAEVGSTVFEEGMDSGSETISIQVCSTPPQIHVNGDSKDIDNSDSNVVHIMPVCAEVQPSSESCRPLTGSRMNHDVEHEGFLVEDVTSSSNTDQVAEIFEKQVLSDERKVNSAQDIDTDTEESHNVLDTGTCLAKDKDAISPINRSHSSSSAAASARIILPTNAVPFSDEWLAAMEAAGEDILKIKSGAVQNSPTEKPMPEPSPWSPVKKKNNQIGPFDCTKFTNSLPSDSQ